MCRFPSLSCWRCSGVDAATSSDGACRVTPSRRTGGGRLTDGRLAMRSRCGKRGRPGAHGFAPPRKSAGAGRKRFCATPNRAPRSLARTGLRPPVALPRSRYALDDTPHHVRRPGAGLPGDRGDLRQLRPSTNHRRGVTSAAQPQDRRSAVPAGKTGIEAYAAIRAAMAR